MNNLLIAIGTGLIGIGLLTNKKQSAKTPITQANDVPKDEPEKPANNSTDSGGESD